MHVEGEGKGEEGAYGRRCRDEGSEARGSTRLLERVLGVTHSNFWGLLTSISCCRSLDAHLHKTTRAPLLLLLAPTRPSKKAETRKSEKKRRRAAESTACCPVKSRETQSIEPAFNGKKEGKDERAKGGGERGVSRFVNHHHRCWELTSLSLPSPPATRNNGNWNGTEPKARNYFGRGKKQSTGFWLDLNFRFCWRWRMITAHRKACAPARCCSLCPAFLSVVAPACYSGPVHIQ